VKSRVLIANCRRISSTSEKVKFLLIVKLIATGQARTFSKAGGLFSDNGRGDRVDFNEKDKKQG